MQSVAWVKAPKLEATDEPVAPRTCLATVRMHQTRRVVAAAGWKVGRWDQLQRGAARLPRAGLEYDAKRFARVEHTRNTISHLRVAWLYIMESAPWELQYTRLHRAASCCMFPS